MTAHTPGTASNSESRKRDAERTEPGRLTHPDPGVREQIREAQERAVNEFVAWVATHRAYNGSDYPYGQSLYNDCINAELPKWARDFTADRIGASS